MKTYTFHVSILGTGRVWRKIEVAEGQTLDDLHWAIQEAFDFDGDHLYSFFMSGKAWDRSSEYTLPEDGFEWEGDDLDDDGANLDDDGDDGDEFGPEIDEFDPEIDEEAVQAIRESLGDTPPPQSFEEMLTLISSNAELRGQMVKLMSEQTGIPAFMADTLLKNADSLMAMLPEEMREGMLDDDEEAQGDVRTTTVGSLGLKPHQSFLYLFDYGDEWRFNVKVDKVNQESEPGVEYPRIVEVVGEAPPQYPDWDDEEEDDEGDDEA